MTTKIINVSAMVSKVSRINERKPLQGEISGVTVRGEGSVASVTVAVVSSEVATGAVYSFSFNAHLSWQIPTIIVHSFSHDKAGCVTIGCMVVGVLTLQLSIPANHDLKG